jgi:hypothetical protein
MAMFHESASDRCKGESIYGPRARSKSNEDPIGRKTEGQHEGAEVESRRRRSDLVGENASDDRRGDNEQVKQREVNSHPDSANRRSKHTRGKAHDWPGGQSTNEAQCDKCRDHGAGTGCHQERGGKKRKAGKHDLDMLAGSIGQYTAEGYRQVGRPTSGQPAT